MSYASEWIKHLNEANGAPGGSLPHGGIMQRVSQDSKVPEVKSKRKKKLTKASETLLTLEGLGDKISAYGGMVADRQKDARMIKKRARQEHRHYKQGIKRQMRQHFRQKGSEVRHQARYDANMARRGML